MEADKEVRKHRAPKGALRQGRFNFVTKVASLIVRKHRAPNGALRLIVPDGGEGVGEESESTERQTVH